MRQFGHETQVPKKLQNHRMFRVGRDLCGSSSPIPLPKQGDLQQAAQDLVQAGLEYLQRRRLHKVPGQPVPGLRPPQREEVLPHVQTELPMLRFVPIAPCPVAGHYYYISLLLLLTEFNVLVLQTISYILFRLCGPNVVNTYVVNLPYT